jgi:hypothetical protein
MIVLLSLAGAAAVAGLAHRYGAEDRPVFNEQPESFRDRDRWI